MFFKFLFCCPDTDASPTRNNRSLFLYLFEISLSWRSKYYSRPRLKDSVQWYSHKLNKGPEDEKKMINKKWSEVSRKWYCKEPGPFPLEKAWQSPNIVSNPFRHSMAWLVLFWKKYNQMAELRSFLLEIEHFVTLLGSSTTGPVNH